MVQPVAGRSCGQSARSGDLKSSLRLLPLAVHPPLAQGAQQMFVSIDEACTHCGASAFRLVAAIYAQAVQPSAAPSSGGEHGSASGAAAATEQQQTAERQRAHQQPEAPAERLLAASVSPLIK